VDLAFAVDASVTMSSTDFFLSKPGFLGIHFEFSAAEITSK
jgi:hypothetical protein